MGIVIRQSIKGTIVNYFGSFLGFLITFFVMTKFLTAEEMGLRDVLVNVATMFAGLAQLGTNSSILRFYPYFKDPEKKDHGFFFWTLVIPLVGLVIFSVIFWLLQKPVETYFSTNSQLFVDYYYFIFPLGFFMLYMAVFETNANVLLRIVVPKFIREIGVRLLALIVYLLYAFKVIDLDGFVMAFCSIYGIAALFNVLYLFSLKRISLKPDFSFITKELRKDFLLYTLFLLSAALTTTLVPVVNSVFISKDLGLSFAGIFAVSTYIAAIIEIPYRSLGAITQPHISQAMKDQNIAEANKLSQSVSLHQLMVGLLIFFAIWINIDFFYQLLPNGDVYQSGKWAVLFLCLYRLINSFLSVGTTVLTYSKYYYYSLIFTLILTVLTVYLNIRLIPEIGIEGAALGSLISCIVYFVLLLTFIKWKIKTSPFSKAQLKVVAIVLAMFLVNALLEWTIKPLIFTLQCHPWLAGAIDAVLRTVVLMAGGWFAVYKWCISEQVNIITDRLFRIKH
ncbi:MAG: lipopolysaccharide biosynthesis protein [Bacteroidales bacterium]|nr:lipopolysaccharide biosynthesis protein [Bacteroidales bacterium]